MTPRTQPLLPFGPVRNSGLFSNHWLENRLPLEPEWDDLREEAQSVLERVADLWRKEKPRVEKYGNEAALEHAFIQPVLELLGWRAKYQPHLRGRDPDYALFLSDATLDSALDVKHTSPDFWKHAALVADAKAWHVRLDRPAVVNNRREYPPEQIEWYMHYSECPYGILTNGRLWRLFPRDLSSDQSRFETYLECELPKILDVWIGAPGQFTFDQQQQALADFMRFYLFFGRTAFITHEDRDPLIKRAIDGSSEYRLGVGEGLRDRVFEALRLCVEGFMTYGPNGLRGDDDLALCREQGFALLYRLLFILYAEDRLLLPFPANDLYARNRSLHRHRGEIATKLDRIEDGRDRQDLPLDRTNYYDDLKSLFDLINSGNKRYHVPPYNGGLFDPDQHPFLEENALSDWYVARIIDQLSRAHDPEHPDRGLFRVDYRDLAIQHLGTIYEGLLELEPHWIDGEIHLLTRKGERRASGSYYTPNHIVDYIVEKTLGPLCTTIDEELGKEIESVEKRMKRARGGNREALQKMHDRLTREYDDRVLQLRVLDPAMGSGHFLLRACAFLAEEIATNPHTHDERAEAVTGDESTLTFWKRRVVERCIYGVDLNRMAVELAQLALWLETIAVDQPLAFVNHHLRHGNSLIGAPIELLGALPTAPRDEGGLFLQRIEGRLPILLEPLATIRAMPSETPEQVKEKERLFRQNVEKVRQPFMLLADLWTSTYFTDEGDQPDPAQYHRALDTVEQPRKFGKLTREPWFARGLESARSSEVTAFHWELEFPDMFFDKAGLREDAGFDAVIGNPPYDVLSEKELGRDISAFKRFIADQEVYEPSRRGKNNLYKLFMCRAISLLANGGRFGFIVPMGILGNDQMREVRRLFLTEGQFESIDAFPQKDNPRRRVFREAKLATVILTFYKTADREERGREFVARQHPADVVESTSPCVGLSTITIPRYDPTNLVIVTTSPDDWSLAARILESGRVSRLDQFVEWFQGEVNETNARNANHLREHSPHLVIRGAAVCLYAVRLASQGGDLYLDAEKFLEGKGIDTKAYHHKYARVIMQNAAPQNNFRRLIAALLPAGQFCSYKLNYCPEPSTTLPLHFLLALVNSKLSDWYFRIGSASADINHYQLNNLPCPIFAPKLDADGRALRDRALAAKREGDIDVSFEILRPALAQPPFSVGVRDVIVDLTKDIIRIEKARGEIPRSARSRLDPKAQPTQDLIDQLFYAMAGLTSDESRGLEHRHSTML